MGARAAEKLPATGRALLRARLTKSDRLTDFRLFLTRSSYVPWGTDDADAQATCASLFHPRPSRRDGGIAIVRGEEGGARPPVPVGRASPHYGTRGAWIHPSGDQPGAVTGRAGEAGTGRETLSS